jgi:hypothetical protein
MRFKFKIMKTESIENPPLRSKRLRHALSALREVLIQLNPFPKASMKSNPSIALLVLKVIAGRAFAHSAGAPSRAALAIQSDFQSECPEGWTATNRDGGLETLVCVDSDSGRFISAQESQGDGKTMYFQAPAKFLGNQSAAYNGMLLYDLRQIHNDQMSHGADVILRGSGVELVYDYDHLPTTNWEHHEVLLSENGSWRFAGTQVYAPAEVILNVLSHLEGLLIRAEFSTRQTERTDLDNVTITYFTGFPPSLDIERLPDGRVDISWSTIETGYRPEISLSLAPDSWQEIIGGELIRNPDGSWHMLIETNWALAFIRLRRD